jgi:ketosteroid isomerase-like protein
MTAENALAIATAYHDAWTAKDFDGAEALLSDQLVVEVPVNDYPTKGSFVQALEGFGSLVYAVRLLLRMGKDNEAMLLYDLDAQVLGRMRVAEHFTISDGKIVRLRQIHDTAAVRAAGLASATE